MIDTRAQLRKLQDRVIEAQAKIRQLFIDSALKEGRGYVWGQFLGETQDRSQYGIFGTSAAVLVLLLAKVSHENELVVGAVKQLAGLISKGKDTSFMEDIDDLEIIYKLSYLAEALEAAKAIKKEFDPRQMIMGRARPKSYGWGHFAGTARPPALNLMATSHAMLALRRYEPFLRSRLFEETVEWVCQQIRGAHGLRPYERALATLALAAQPQAGLLGDHLRENYREALKVSANTLLAWASRRERVLYGHFQMYYYQAVHHRINRYLFYLPDCVVALALLKTAPEAGHNYIVGVVDYYATRVISGGFTADETEKMAAVEHLWIYRLLEDFRTAPEARLLPGLIGRLSRSRVLWRVLPLLIGLGAFLCGSASLVVGISLFIAAVAIGVWQEVLSRSRSSD